jgi:beta-lactamase class A
MGAQVVVQRAGGLPAHGSACRLDHGRHTGLGQGGLRRLSDANLRRVNDTTTVVSRNEPALNEAVPGDQRDTSTPRALGADLRRYVLEDVLPEPCRRKLAVLLLGNTTGDAYIRAGVPSGWKVGDKPAAAALIAEATEVVIASLR